MPEDNTKKKELSEKKTEGVWIGHLKKLIL